MKNNNYSNKFQITLLCYLNIIIVLYSGCFFSVKPIYNEEEIKAAENATKEFRQLYNEKKFEELFDLTDQRARATKKKEDFLRLLDFVYSQNGRNEKSKLMDSKVVPHAAFSEVQLLYETNFENGTQYETFIWYVDNGKAGLFSYGITDMKQLESNK